MFWIKYCCFLKGSNWELLRPWAWLYCSILDWIGKFTWMKIKTPVIVFRHFFICLMSGKVIIIFHGLIAILFHGYFQSSFTTSILQTFESPSHFASYHSAPIIHAAAPDVWLACVKTVGWKIPAVLKLADEWNL